MSTKVNTNFEPIHPRDDVYIVDDKHVRGGYTVVNTIEERDALPLSARKLGMIVYVVSEDREYTLENTITVWEEKTYNNVNLPSYVRKHDGELSGFPTYTNEAYFLSANITAIRPEDSLIPNDDYSFDFIRMDRVTEQDAEFLARGCIVEGETSGAYAYVLEVLRLEGDNGFVVSSVGAEEVYENQRDGEFLLGERVFVRPSAALATKDEHLITKYGADRLYVGARGGTVRGPLKAEPSVNLRLRATLDDVVEYEFLDMCEVKLNLLSLDDTLNDLLYVQDGIDITINGTPMDTIYTRLGTTTDSGTPASVWVPYRYWDQLAAIQAADSIEVKPQQRVYAPVEDSSYVNKLYVDRRFATRDFTMERLHWTNNRVEIDPADGISKTVFTATIPHTLLDDRWPDIALFEVVEGENGRVEYHEVTSDSQYRTVIFEDDGHYAIDIKSWGTAPSSLKVVIK